MQITGPLPEKIASEDEQALFKRLFVASPDAIVVTSGDGRISAVNPATERLFGYTQAELIGNYVEMLIPERFRGQHPHHRNTYAANPSVRPMGTGLELFGLRKDGTEFPVDIMLSPVETNGEHTVLTVVRDITRRKTPSLLSGRARSAFACSWTVPATMRSSCWILREESLAGILALNESRDIGQKRSLASISRSFTLGKASSAGSRSTS